MPYNSVEILHVEDNFNDAEFTKRALKKYINEKNYHHVIDGEEALAFIFAEDKYSERNKEDLLKLIILDLKIPKIKGIEVLKKIKSNEVTNTIPVIILTSSKEQQDIKDAYKYGANCYIVKPIEFELFENTIDTLGLFWLEINHPPIK